MSSTRPCLANACAIDSDDGRVTAFGDVRHGFEESHGTTLRLHGMPTEDRRDVTGADPALSRRSPHSTAISPAAGAVGTAGFSIESSPVVQGDGGTAGVSLRAGTRNRRRSSRRTLAGPGRAHAPCVARARRGRVRCDVLLRVGDALLSGTGVGPRRSDAVARRAAPLRTLARRGASPPPPHADPHGRRPRGNGDRRHANAHRVCRQELPRRRRDRRSRSPIPRARAPGSTSPRTGGGSARPSPTLGARSLGSTILADRPRRACATMPRDGDQAEPETTR